MRVRSVKINNFRSISETSFILSDTVTAIAGGNESGKSNALKAIHRFLRQENFDESDRYQLSSENPRITVNFDDFNETEKQEISKILRQTNVNELIIERVGNNYQIINFDIEKILQKEKEEAKKLEEQNLAKEANEDEGGVSEDEAEAENVQADIAEKTEQDTKDEILEKTEQITEDKELPDSLEEITQAVLRYLPDSELINDVSSLITGDGILIEKIYADKYESKDEENRYSTIRALLEVGNITKDDLLEKDINKRIQVLRKKSADIAIQIRSAWSQEDVKLELVADNKNLVIHFRDGKNIPDEDREDDTKWIWTLPENRSFGFRWYVTFYAKYLSRIKNTVDDDILFLIDDAGLGLNKTAQIDLLGEFTKIAKSKENNGINKQVIYVSHSKYMFDWDMRRQILVANKENGQGTIIEDFWWEKFSKNDLPAPLDELGVNWLENLLDEKNLITEGHSDGYIINRLIAVFADELNIKDVLSGFKVIPGNNIQGQFDLAKLCSVDNRKFLLLFDSDEPGKNARKGAEKENRRYHASEIADLIRSPINDKNFVTIEDFIPTHLLVNPINKRGEQFFKEEWQEIVRFNQPNIHKDGFVKYLENRLQVNYPSDQVKEFLKGKYYFVLYALENMSSGDFDEDQRQAVANFLKNLNDKLVSIS